MKTQIAILTLLILTIVTVSATELPAGSLHDDTTPMLDYSGTWGTGTDASAVGGGYASTTDASSALSFDLESDGFVVYFLTHVTGASVDVCVESDCIAVATAGGAARSSVEITDLAPGLKSVTVQKSADDGTEFRFDAVYIYPLSATSAETTPEPYSTETTHTDQNGDLFAGQVVLSVSAGEMYIFGALIVVALLLAVLVILQVVQND